MNIELVVRGHTFEDKGFHVFVSLAHTRRLHGDAQKHAGHERVITVFSAPNYMGRYGNPGGVLDIDANLHVTVRLLDAFPPGASQFVPPSNVLLFTVVNNSKKPRESLRRA
jgi:hypothetical protein